MNLKISRYLAVLLSLNALSPAVWASSQTVRDPDIDATNGLRKAILNINSCPPQPNTSNTINFTLPANSSLTTSSSSYNLPPIDIGNTSTLAITANNPVNFNGSLLSAAQAPFRGLFINSGT